RRPGASRALLCGGGRRRAPATNPLSAVRARGGAMTAAKHAGSHETPYYPDPSEAQGINLTEILSILVRRRAVLLGIAGAVLLLVLAYWAFATPTYTATVQLLLEPKTQRTADERPSPDQLTLDGITTLVESQLRIIESRSVLYDVVASQQLEHDPEFNRRGLIF